MRYLFFVLLVLGFTITVEAKKLNKDHEDKIAFIDSLKVFIKQELRLDVKSTFFTTWYKGRRPEYYLYISKVDTCQVPKDLPPYIYCRRNLRQAKRLKKQYEHQKRDVLLYHTHVSFSTKLSAGLLNYTKEEIGFLVLHEAFHQHLYIHQKKIPYAIEEASCDVIALQALQQFIGQIDTSLKTKVSSFKHEIEKISLFINSYSPSSGSITIPKHWSFLHDRYQYPINQAYLLRHSYYSRYYFILQKVFNEKKHLNDFIDTVFHLPSNLDDALHRL